jgi:hypothetical protein
MRSWFARMDRVFLFGVVVFLLGVIMRAGVLVLAGLVLEVVGSFRARRGRTRR